MWNPVRSSLLRLQKQRAHILRNMSALEQLQGEEYTAKKKYGKAQQRARRVELDNEFSEQGAAGFKNIPNVARYATERQDQGHEFLRIVDAQIRRREKILEFMTKTARLFRRRRSKK